MSCEETRVLAKKVRELETILCDVIQGFYGIHFAVVLAAEAAGGIDRSRLVANLEKLAEGRAPLIVEMILGVRDALRVEELPAAPRFRVINGNEAVL